MQSGKTSKKIVYEKQVVFCAAKYARKARAQRNELVKKALVLIDSPQKYNQATSYGAAKYVKNLQFDQQTGEVLKEKQRPCLDLTKLEEEEIYDGYYCIVTSELDMSDQKIIDTYRGLWEIEETFKITKGTLEARPVYLSRKDRIEAHFLICFIALTIIRLLQKLTKRRFSPEKIVACLNSIACFNKQDSLYLFGYRSAVSGAIGETLGIDFTRKRLRLKEIKTFWLKVINGLFLHIL